MTEQKIEAFWRDATAADVAKVMRGEKVEARFRDEDAEDWQDCLLAGWRISRYYPGVFWLDLDEITWKQCQVYDPPQWWLDKPDPGEGYRLLEKFPPENVKPGDCFYGCGSIWVEEMHHVTVQAETIWYRRRIEPVETVESKPLLIRRRVIEIGDEIKLPNGRVLVFNGEGFEVP
jgi:hypothetical protein